MKLKLLLAPQPSMRMDVRIPPHGLSALTGYLRKKGFNVDQDDLDIKAIYYYKKSGMNKININVFNDLERIKRYLSGTDDYYLQYVVRKLLRKTEYGGFEIIGFSIYSYSNLMTSLVLAKKIKQETGAKIVFGGTLNPSSELLEKYPFIDYLVHGEGEIPLEILINMMERGDIKEKEIPGLIYRDGGKICKNREKYLPIEEKFIDLDGLPLDLYRKQYEDGNKFRDILILPYQCFKGCPFACSFCKPVDDNGNPHDCLVRKKTPEKIISELEILSEKYKTKFFFFLNNEINFNYSYPEELADTLIKNKMDISWSDSARADTFDKKLLEKLHKSGCIKLVYGLESASNRILKLMNKRYTIEKAEKIIKLSSQVGIWNEINLIPGFISEREEDIQMNISFLKRNSCYIDSFNNSPFWIQKNTIIHKFPEKFRIKIYKNQFNPIELTDNQCGEFKFEEIGHLSCKEKEIQIQESFERLGEAWEKFKGMPRVYPPHLIFYLYSKFDDKQGIVEWLRNNYN